MPSTLRKSAILPPLVLDDDLRDAIPLSAVLKSLKKQQPMTTTTSGTPLFSHVPSSSSSTVSSGPLYIPGGPEVKFYEFYTEEEISKGHVGFSHLADNPLADVRNRRYTELRQPGKVVFRRVDRKETYTVWRQATPGLVASRKPTLEHFMLPPQPEPSDRGTGFKDDNKYKGVKQMSRFTES